jgi:predicted phage baseplate assembly protein
MPLPEPILDDLRFQRDLVDEARRRIIRYCPEWTEYNLSDPGITLIELFAWMTEMITYRLNRVPEKNYIKFMEMLGIQLQPASSARVELTFRLSTPLPITPEDEMVVTVPQGFEVATRATDEEEEVTFTTDRRLNVIPPRLGQLRREEDFQKNYLPRLGIEVFYAFNRQRPQPGDTFYLGFAEDQDISGHILQLAFQCQETQATGIKRDDPPLVWECSMGAGNWQEVPPSTVTGERDTTGGLNNPEGALTLYLPLGMRPDSVHGRYAFWLRCRLEQRRREQGMYTQSPRIRNVNAFSLGATTPATHAVIVKDEMLGRSSGEPGQVFRLAHAPVLAPTADEVLEVEEIRDGELVFAPWAHVADFADSDMFARHYSLDTATGEVRFGPVVRQRDGNARQYGRVPEAGREIRFSQYRYGGGVIGNVPAGKIQVMKSAIPYVDRVNNLRRAEGGRDAESLDEAKLRARREVRAQERAVTVQDFENLARAATRTVARAVCNTPGKTNGSLPPGTIELLVVPAAHDSLRAGDLTKLAIDSALVVKVQDHLDQYRLLTTNLRIREPQYVGVKVTAEVVAGEYSQPDVVRARALEALRNFLSPLPLDDSLGADWEGWPFGKDLYVAEVYSLLEKVPGVRYVMSVSLSHRPVAPIKETPPEVQATAEGEGEGPAEAPLTEVPLNQRSIAIPKGALVVSLDHDIQMVTMADQ